VVPLQGKVLLLGQNARPAKQQQQQQQVPSEQQQQQQQHQH
jgi:hypothetical protein